MTNRHELAEGIKALLRDNPDLTAAKRKALAELFEVDAEFVERMLMEMKGEM